MILLEVFFVVEVVAEENDVIVGTEIEVTVFSSEIEPDLFWLHRFSQPFHEQLHIPCAYRVVDGQMLIIEREREE